MFAIGNDKGMDELSDILEMNYGKNIELEEIGRSGDVTFFLTLFPERSTDIMDTLKENIEPEYPACRLHYFSRRESKSFAAATIR